jgi:ABC-2 type transport system permease protein
MIDSIRSEFRKLLTTRSTYLLVIISLLITAFFAGFVEGFQNTPDALRDPELLVRESTHAIVFVGILLAFVGLLVLGHEYRYNTIMYTLTSSNRRLKSLVAKVLVISVFALAMSLLITFFSPLCTIIGARLHGMSLGPQTYDYWSVIWRCLFVGWGYAMYAFILIAIMRNQVGAIVSFLLVPLFGENILSLLLKNNATYLPFTSLQSIGNPALTESATTPGRQALIVLAYVSVGLLVSTVLFVRRDAN